MHTIFQIVYNVLKRLSSVTGLTYNEINIVVYFIIIPLIYLVMIDKIIHKHILKLTFGGLVISIVAFADFKSFSDSVFAASVKFLLSFENIGWNYVVASVIVCVIVPMIVFCVLFYFSFWPYIKNKFFRKISLSDED